MVAVPKAAISPATNNVSNVRRSGPPTRVASTGQSVEELPGSNSVAFNSGAFGFREEGQSSFDQGGDRRGSNHLPTGVANAPTESFAALLEAGTQESQGGADDVTKPKSPGLVSKVISIYEANASILSGEHNVLGTSISIVL